MKVVFWFASNLFFSFVAAALLVAIYAACNVNMYPFYYYWAAAFLGCLLYDCIKDSLSNKQDEEEEK